MTVTVHVCDNPACNDEKTVPEREQYSGLEGTIDTPVLGRSFDALDWTACSEDCVVPAIRAIRDAGMEKKKGR